MKQKSVIMSFWTNLILDLWLVSQRSAWGQHLPLPPEVSGGYFQEELVSLVLAAQQFLVTSSSRIFCGYFTHTYYNAINLVSQRIIFKTPELWKRKFSTYLTTLHCCSFFSQAFHKGNVFWRTGDNRTMTQVLPVREYFKGTSVMCKEISHIKPAYIEKYHFGP